MRFIDFDWAGRAGDVCYPPFMNHRDDVWPLDVQEFAPALQRHDKALLKRQLTRRSPSVMYMQPNAAWQPKNRFQSLQRLCSYSNMCPRARIV